MALSQLFLAALQREVIVDIPDERIKPFGGPFGQVIPDRDRSHRELIEYDRRTPTIANLVAYNALNIRSVRQSTTLTEARAVQFVRHEEVSQEDMVWLDSIESAISDARISREVYEWGQNIQERNRAGVEIMRGYLCSSMVVGEIDWSKYGFDFESSSFGMPAEMKVMPSIPLRNAAGVTNVNSTFLRDVAELNSYVSTVKGRPKFDSIGMSEDAVRALTETTEYQNQAKSMLGYTVAALPIPRTPKYYDLVELVLGMRLIIIDNTFEVEDPNGNRTSFRYTPERLAVLWRQADENNQGKWEFSKPPMTKQMIAKMGGSDKWGGAVSRGPIAWGSFEDQQFTGAALYVANEGIPRRHDLYVSAVIETRFDI